VGEPSVAPGDPKVEAGAGAIDDGVETAGVDAAGAGTEYGEDAGALLAAGGGADVPVAAEGTWARGVANCTRWAKAAGAATDHHTAARPQIIVAVFTHSPFQLGGEATRGRGPLWARHSTGWMTRCSVSGLTAKGANLLDQDMGPWYTYAE
jgi:hypothetical protein